MTGLMLRVSSTIICTVNIKRLNFLKKELSEKTALFLALGVDDVITIYSQ